MGATQIDEVVGSGDGNAFPELRLLKVFLENLEFERRLSSHTSRNYGHAVNRFFSWMRASVGWKGDLKDISKSLVRSFLVEQQRSLSRRTLRNHASGIRSFFNYCLSRGLVEVNPFQGVTLPKLPKTLPKFLTESQADQLLAQPIKMVESDGAEPFIVFPLVALIYFLLCFPLTLLSRRLEQSLNVDSKKLMLTINKGG